MMVMYIGKAYGLNDLKAERIPENDIRRHEVSIAIIDDEPFPYTDTLIRHDFNVRELGDIEDIKAVHTYSVVLCDIKGVGKSFGSRFEGGHVIEEIRRYYPSKILIAYTSHQVDPTYNMFFQLCDFTLKKDIDSDEWVSCLDNAIRLAQDPVVQWGKLRLSMIDRGISLVDLVRLEDAFVRAMLGKSEGFKHENVSKGLTGDVRQLLINFVSGAAIKLLVG